MSEIKECCQNLDNLYEVPDDRPKVKINKCRVCGCRHIEVVVEPGELGVFGSGV